MVSAIFNAANQNLAPMPDTKSNQTEHEKPPIFQSWRQFYIFVLSLHAFIIILFYIFKIVYS